MVYLLKLIETLFLITESNFIYAVSIITGSIIISLYYIYTLVMLYLL